MTHVATDNFLTKKYGRLDNCWRCEDAFYYSQVFRDKIQTGIFFID